MDEDHSTSDVRRALALLQKHLEFDSSNIIRTIDDLSAAHPELATALKTVGLAFRAGQELPLSRSLQDLPREEMDGAYDITAVLDSDAEVDNLSLNTNVSLLGDPNRYVVQAEVARGGMGVIYRVQDKALHRTLAMKVMSDRATHSSQASSASVTSRFHEEAQVTAQLDHPGIVSVHELSVDSAGRPFFTMKLVKGREFSEIVQLVKRGEEGWSLSRAVGILVNICQTVAFAHSKNVIHRDLKPANIMVGRFGEVYVMDWGLAKIRGRDDLHDIRFAPEAQNTLTTIRSSRSDASANDNSPLVTMDGSVVGTPAFMPLEQARGNVEAVDHQSDVYSLGAILYELLTGQPPYVDPEARMSPHTILAKVLDGPPKSLSELSPQSPAELIAICDKAMAREKPHRYKSSLAMAEDLQAWLDHRVVCAYRTGPVAELTSWVRRNRLVACVVALSLAILAISAGWWAYNQHEASIQLKYRLAQQYLHRGQALCDEGRIDDGLHWFVRSLRMCPDHSTHLKEDVQTNLFAWSERTNRLLQAVDHESKLTRPGLTSRSLALAFSPDGSQLLTGGRYDGAVRIWTLDTGRPMGEPMNHGCPVRNIFCTLDGERVITVGEDDKVRLWTRSGQPIGKPISFASSISSVRFAPEYSLLAVGTNDGTSSLWSASDTQPVGEPMRHQSTVTAFAFTTNGQRLLVGYADSTARVWSVVTGEQIGSTIQDLGGRVVEFSPDGAAIAVLDEEGSVQLWALDSAKPIGASIRHDKKITIVRFSPNASLLATACDDTIRLWAAHDGTSIGPPMAHQSLLRTISFSPDGALLLTGCNDYSARLWSTASGKRVGAVVTNAAVIRSVAFDSAGKQIAISSAGKAEVWSVEVLPKPVAVYPTTRNAWGVDFSPSGTRVLTAGLDKLLRIWGTKTAEKIHEFPEFGEIWEAKFSPNGRRLVVGYGDPYGARLWDIETRDSLVLHHDATVRSVAFNLPGTLVATGSFDNSARIWNAETGEMIAAMEHPDYVEDLVFAKNDATLLTACADGRVRIWSTNDYTEVSEPLKHNDSVLAIDISPDGHLIATGSRDGTVRFWSVDTGTPHGSVLVHGAWVEDIAFSPNGHFIITGCADGTAQLWSVRSGQKIGPPLPHSKPVRSVAFAPQGSHVLTGGSEPGAKLWAVPAPTIEPIGDLELWVRVLTGKMMDEDGVMSRLSHSQWRDARSMNATKGSGRSGASSPADYTD